MTSILKVWVVDPQKPNDAPKYDSTPRLVNVTDFETMKKSAQEMLTRSNYMIRSISHTQNGEMVAYVYNKTDKPMQAIPVKGWVFKRSKASTEV